MHLPPYSFLSHSLSQRTGERKHAQFHGRSDTEHARTCWKASLHFPFQELLIKLIAQKVSRSKCDSTTAMDPGNGWQEGLGGGDATNGLWNQSDPGSSPLIPEL